MKIEDNVDKLMEAQREIADIRSKLINQDLMYDTRGNEEYTRRYTKRYKEAKAEYVALLKEIVKSEDPQ